MAGDNVRVQVFYDREADILEVMLAGRDPSRPYVSREIAHGMFAHVEPKTDKVIGFALHHFSQDFSKKPLSVPLSVSFQALKRTEHDLASAR